MSHHNIRNTRPIVLAPLSPEQALRQAMSVPAPASDPPLPKAKKKAKKGKKP